MEAGEEREGNACGVGCWILGRGGGSGAFVEGAGALRGVGIGSMTATAAEKSISGPKSSSILR